MSKIHHPLGNGSRLSSRVLPSPIQLSRAVALDNAWLGDPPIRVRELAIELGISRIEERPELKSVGQLSLLDGELCISVSPGASEQRHRFTIAHEIGHYLLAVECAYPLSRQVGSWRVEVFCNSFASHLLIPSQWLRKYWSEAPVSLSTIESVACKAQVSQASAAAALARSLDSWHALFMLWRRRENTWYAPTCIGSSNRQVKSVEATDQTGEILEKAIRSKTRSHRIPMLVDGERMTIDCEIVALKSVVAVLAHTSS